MAGSRWAHRLRHFRPRVVGSLRRGRLFENSLSFALREVMPARGQAAFYVPRGAKHGVTVRHHTPDAFVVQEIFGRGDYEPPAEVRAALARLGRPPRILDLGGHVGVFGVFALTIAPGASLLSLEPDPESYALLSANARRSGEDWTVLEAAASATTGWARFAATGGPNAGLRSDRQQKDMRTGETEVLTLDVLPLLAQVDLAKIDIEGGEWAIFEDPRWAIGAPDLLALEFHPAGCSRADFQAVAVEAVAAAGLRHAIIPGTPHGAGMLWAWRQPPR